MRTARAAPVPLALAGLALIAAGCGGGDNDNEKASKPAPVAPKPSKPAGGGMMTVDTGATLTVSSPNPGKVVTGNHVPFGVDISNFRVDCRFAGTPNRKGVGHYHVELDGKLINMFCGDRDSVSLQNVDPGRHTLQFIPAANEHEDDLKAEKKISFGAQADQAEKAAGKRRGRAFISTLTDMISILMTATVAPAPFVLPDAPTEPELVAKYFAVLSDVTRVRLLELLQAHGELSVGEMVAALGVPQPKVSHHLGCLRWCGFVATRREHRTVHYRIADERVAELLALGRALLADNAEHVAACRAARGGER